MTDGAAQVLIHKPAQLTLKKDKTRVPGTLSVTKAALEFAGQGEVEQRYPLGTITGVRRAKGKPIMRLQYTTGEAMFEMSTVEDMDALLAILNPLRHAAAGTGTASVIPPADIQKAVYKAHPELEAMYKRLVVPKYISELEFWSSKQPQVKAARQNAGAQQTGLSTAILDLINNPPDRAGMADIFISPEIEAQIFAETPGLRAMYSATVPHRRSREEFFQEYVNMLRLRISRRRKKAAGTLSANDALLNEFEEELARHASDLQQGFSSAKRQRLAAADAAVDLAADRHDGFSMGYGTAHRPGAEGDVVRAAGGSAGDIASELNTHASVVLEGRGGGAGNAAVVEAAEERSRSGLEDLRRREAQPVAQLQINDPHKYFEHAERDGGAQSEPAAAPPATDPLAAARAVLANYDALLESGLGGDAALPMDPGGAAAAARDMGSGVGGEGELDDDGRRKNPTAVLLPQMIAGFREHAQQVNELLRHFWRAIPVTTRGRAAKLKRVETALKAFYQENEVMLASAAPQERVYVSQMLRGSLRAMDKAFDTYAGLEGALDRMLQAPS